MGSSPNRREGGSKIAGLPSSDLVEHGRVSPSTVAEALPDAEFTEYHERVIDSPPELVWDGLLTTRWSDLRVTLPLLLVRGLALRLPQGDSAFIVASDGPIPVVLIEDRRYIASGAVMQPWHPRARFGPTMSSLAQLQEFSEPGWLKAGLEFRLHALSGGRTRLTTATVCAPTDAAARKQFSPYWRMIRPLSGLIRQDMLRAVSHRTRRIRAARRRPIGVR